MILFNIFPCSQEELINREGKNDAAKHSLVANKRKAQQSPITSYFQKRKDVQENEVKKVKLGNVGKIRPN